MNQSYDRTIKKGNRLIERIKQEIQTVTLEGNVSQFCSFWHPRVIVFVNGNKMNRKKFQNIHVDIISDNSKMTVNNEEYGVISTNMIYGHVIFTTTPKSNKKNRRYIEIRFVAKYNNETPARIVRLWETLKIY